MKKTWIALPVAAIMTVGLLACDTNPAGLAPEGANRQLVDESQRIADNAADLVYAYATFSISQEGQAPYRDVGSPGINGAGKEMGKCLASGRWENPAGKPAGAIPHPFCITGGEEDVLIQLEVINSRRWQHNQNVYRMAFDVEEELRVQFNSSSGNTSGAGVMHAIALRNGVPFGKFVVDLTQYNQQNENLLNGQCYIGEELEEADQILDTDNWRGCLDRSINALFFEDIDADPDVDEEDDVVGGYIYWEEPASA
jgi:hypothetical protein